MKSIVAKILKTKIAQTLLVELMTTLFNQFCSTTHLRPDEIQLILVLKNYLIRRLKGDEE